MAAAPPLPRDLYHIYKYIHKYITYKSESGRQAPHRGSADTVTCLRNSRKGGLGSQKRAPGVFSCPGGLAPSHPALQVQFVQYGELP